MIGEELDIYIEEERAKLDAFGEEVRQFFQQLSQDIEADFSRLMVRLGEQKEQVLGNRGDSLLSKADGMRFSAQLHEGLGQISGNNAGQDSVLGRALQSVIGATISGGIQSHRVRPRTLVRRVAGIFGIQLGHELAGELGFGEPETMRFSRGQDAFEKAAAMQRAMRHR